jgi:hypothetical protein
MSTLLFVQAPGAPDPRDHRSPRWPIIPRRG